MKAKVIMLETTEKQITLQDFHDWRIVLMSNQLLFVEQNMIGDTLQIVELYLTDINAEIKENDWVYENNLNSEQSIYQIYKRNDKLGFFRFRNVFISLNEQHKALKVICSTDKSLVFNNTFIKEVQAVRMECSHNKEVPQLSEQSIQLLINYYNENGKMPDEVDVEEEVECYGHPDIACPEQSYMYSTVKLNRQGTVDISIPEEIINNQITEIKEISSKELIGKPLEDYIKSCHTQEECIGFIDGWNAYKDIISEEKKYSREDVIALIKKHRRETYNGYSSNKWISNNL